MRQGQYSYKGRCINEARHDTNGRTGSGGKGDRPWAAVACEHGANAAKHAVPSRKFLARSAKLDLRSWRSFRKLHDAF